MDRPDPVLAPAPRTEAIYIEGREPVPVTLLTGFLGSGKTTLLNRILNGQHGLRVGVLVNDFGAINIDAELVEGVEENTISLTNGCVCCEIRDDLVNSLEQLLTRVEAIDYGFQTGTLLTQVLCPFRIVPHFRVFQFEPDLL